MPDQINSVITAAEKAAADAKAAATADVAKVEGFWTKQLAWAKAHYVIVTAAIVTVAVALAWVL